VFTALIEDRPYRAGMTREQVFRVLEDMRKENALDGDCISVLKNNYPAILGTMAAAEREVMEEYEAIIKE